MSNTQKNQAQVLAVALDIGAASVSDVVAWADAVIAVEEHPHWAVCELATMGASYEPDVVRALRDVPGVVDDQWVRGEVLRRLGQGLAQDRSRADRVASALFGLAMANELPEGELASLARWASDALGLADQRIIEQTREEVIDEMLAVLNTAAAKTPAAT